MYATLLLNWDGHNVYARIQLGKHEVHFISQGDIIPRPYGNGSKGSNDL